MVRTSVEVREASLEETDWGRLLPNVASVVVTTLPVSGIRMRQPFWLETACPYPRRMPLAARGMTLLGDVTLDTDICFDTKGAKVTQARCVAVAHLVRRGVVGVGGARQTVVHMDRCNNSFAPEARWQGGVHQHCARHSEDGTDSRFGDTILVRGSDARELTFNVALGEKGIDQAVFVFGAVVRANDVSAENGVRGGGNAKNSTHGSTGGFHRGTLEE